MLVLDLVSLSRTIVHVIKVYEELSYVSLQGILRGVIVCTGCEAGSGQSLIDFAPSAKYFLIFLLFPDLFLVQTFRLFVLDAHRFLGLR